jgi:PAS domain-containing protein
MTEAENSISFLFDDETLIDATPRARSLLDDSDSLRSDWENFLTLLSARFPHLRSQCRDLASIGKKTITSKDGEPGWIEAEYWNGLARLTLVQDQDCPTEMIEPLTAQAMEHELETLRSLGENSPQLIWKRDAEGVLIWANRAYIEMSEALFPRSDDGVRPWPPQDVFPDAGVPPCSAPIVEMHSISMVGQPKPSWFEVTSLKRGTDTMYFGIDATAVVTSREAQQTFVQTLSKTFAQLSVGLAIFDEKRQLVLFNPALADLTALPIGFLISKPALFAVLDRLRDTQMIPEPKDYADWRSQMIALEKAAKDGTYMETWMLPNGQTFRVTGRPHPNGAVAFLFEDISDEISLARRYRNQIDIQNVVLDKIDTAIAVFSPSGLLVLANAPYKALWDASADTSLTENTFLDELGLWQRYAAPSPVWVKLHQTIDKGVPTPGWSDTFILDDKGEVTCTYNALPDGNHLVSFVKTMQKAVPVPDVETLSFKSNISAAR